MRARACLPVYVYVCVYARTCLCVYARFTPYAISFYKKLKQLMRQHYGNQLEQGDLLSLDFPINTSR